MECWSSCLKQFATKRHEEPAIADPGALKQIGEGAYGTVFECVHEGTLVAVKRIDASSVSAHAAAKREATLHESLVHTNIARLYANHLVDDEVWLIMEHGGAKTLLDLSMDVLHESSRCAYFSALASAIEYLHARRVAHRDLKMENVMVDPSTHRLRLIDFGFAYRYKDDEPEVSLTKPCGTVSYLAPEVVSRRRYSGFRADVWSMGVVLYAMVFGAFPVTMASMRNPQYVFAWHAQTHEQTDPLASFANAYAPPVDVARATFAERDAINAMLRIHHRATAREVVALLPASTQTEPAPPPACAAST